MSSPAPSWTWSFDHLRLERGEFGVSQRTRLTQPLCLIELSDRIRLLDGIGGWRGSDAARCLELHLQRAVVGSLVGTGVRPGERHPRLSWPIQEQHAQIFSAPQVASPTPSGVDAHTSV